MADRMAYVIKRYSNRKLYDPQESRYVTLEELAEMIRMGTQISVVDAATGEDLTSVVLAQILFEKERHGHMALPTAFLHQLIQYGETWQEFALQSLKASLEGIMTSQREADRVLREWARRCGWLLPSQPETRAARHAETASEIENLKREMATLRAQLQTLTERLDRQPDPHRRAE